MGARCLSQRVYENTSLLPSHAPFSRRGQGYVIVLPTETPLAFPCVEHKSKDSLILLSL